MTESVGDIASSVAALERFSGIGSASLTDRIANLEFNLCGTERYNVRDLLSRSGVAEEMLEGALAVKRMAGQVNVVIHALGILLALPSILEDNEKVEELSLGAGNTGRSFDLTTNLRLAEFKFISWRGGAEAIRQNSLFVDLYHLAEVDTDKRRQIYLTNLVYPLRFLQGRRNLRSVLTKHGSVAQEFFQQYGDRYQVVREYWQDIEDRVELVDVSTFVPKFGSMPPEVVQAAESI